MLALRSRCAPVCGRVGEVIVKCDWAGVHFAVMKVEFKATVDDFVDTYKRSGVPAKNRRLMVGLAILAAGIFGILAMLMVESRPARIIGTAVLLVFFIIVLPSPKANMRRFVITQLGVSEPADCVIEISEEGLSCRALGVTSICDWLLIKNIEETEDAIYFHTGFRSIVAVRKRGFASEEEKERFIKYAAELMQKAAYGKDETI
jgi:YcxB-like protein